MNRLRALLALIVVSAVAGVVAAGVLVPLVGGAGVAAKSASESFESLPTQLTMPQLAQRTRILAADGTTIATFYYQNREIVPLKSVPVIARNAVIAIEDSRFYQDNGVDLKGILRAGVTDAGAGGAQQGASTLAQQLVKNILLQSATTKEQQQAATADTVSRKIREARYAIALDKKLSKDQILDRYLNIVYFGEGAYGIAAAARHYFGEPVQQLTLPQAAMLAGLVRNPSGYDPVRHADAARDRRNTVLARMQQLGYITAAQEEQASSEPLGIKITEAGNGCEASWAPFFCDYIIQQVLADKSLGKTVDERRQLLLTGGLTIRTTLDPKVQKAAQKAVDKVIPPKNKDNNGHGIATAAVTIDPTTGGVVGMAVDRTFGHKKALGVTSVNYATGGSTGYQAGSTMKAFVLAAAIKQGIPLSSSYDCPQTYESKAFPNDRPFPYPVHNAGDSEAGSFGLVQATWRSVNTCYVQIEAQTGAKAPARLADQMGVHLFPDKKLLPVASFFLGVNSVSPIDMAGGYATFANHGVYCAKHGITRVVDADGKTLQDVKPDCTRVLSAHVADTVTSVLRGVIDGPDPYRTGLNASIGRPAAGKTGTTDDEQEAWFVGYTPQLATAVWVGDPRGPKYPLHHIHAVGRDYSVVYGGDLPAMIWSRTMKGALAGVPVKDFALPPAAATAKAKKTHHASSSDGGSTPAPPAPPTTPPATKPPAPPTHGHGHGHGHKKP